MRLINVKKGVELFVINDDQSVEIKEPTLKKYFQNTGVHIPSALKGSFDDQDFVKLGEKKFASALRQVYWRLNMDNEVYKWFE